MNVLGDAPSTLGQLTVALYRNPRNPQGGRRPIGFFRSKTRIYSTGLSNARRRWESAWGPCKFFNAAPRRSTADAARRQAVRIPLA
eukprot:7791118-Pyramimonas_sp.AAC.1